tara:strand:- start:42 stop:1337 length:1296 start_codon:yes stop_codon:yes gene_type:complete
MPTDLSPRSETSAVVLPSTGSYSLVAASLPFGVYTGSVAFTSGAVSQVSYVYKKLGGDVVDIELTPSNVYAAYEEAVLEYSYIINLHQGKNMLASVLGETTGTFDHRGNLLAGDLSSSLAGTSVTTKFPRFQLGYARTVGEGLTTADGFGGTVTQYSASFKPVVNQQDYDLQSIISSSSASGKNEAGQAVDYAGKVKDNHVIITKVYYMSPRAMWRFYGYYGGIGVVGNYSTYGQFADDSTFEMVPTWQNKLQAIMYEDSIYTRTSQYSYELINNRIRLYPTPSYWGGDGTDDKVWVRFYIDTDAWEEDDNYKSGVNGINNINTVPFDNLPYENINSIGKQWIRKYCLALCKEMLGQIRGKFTTMPIPGESVTLNHAELLTQAKEEQAELKDKLKEMLKELEYSSLVKVEQEITEATTNVMKATGLPIFVG